MSASETDDINRNCQVWYEKALDAAKTKKETGEKLSIQETMVYHADQWYIRALFPLVHLWLVRVAQDIMNPGDDEPDDHDIPK